MTTQVIILGSTGSIGTQALDVIRAHPDLFDVVGLAAGGGQEELFLQQIREFSPRMVATSRPVQNLPSGQNAVEELAGSFPDATVLNAVAGGVGLVSTLRALEAGATVALANKESLVVGGRLVKDAMQRPGQVIPVDSEHSAIAQALLAGTHEKGMVSPVVTGKSDLREIVLTASGGPFRGKKTSELRDVTAKQALAHPTWNMGPVVTINSSTLMNKGLELIEAALLFDVAPDSITPVIHPQSVVHSMVTWNDGSTIAQASYPDMKVPIALGLQWPTHIPHVGAPLRWREAQNWEFEPVDHEVFPALRLAAEALKSSATHPSVMNAANEVCVDAFLHGRLGWLQMMDVVSRVLSEHEGIENPDVDAVLDAQEWAAARAGELL